MYMLKRPITFIALLALSRGGIGAPLEKSKPEEIIKRYTIVADFNMYPEERKISEEIFWKYPFKMGEITFDIVPPINTKAELFPTSGHGEYIQQVNRGRIAFLNGDFEAAKDMFLAARAKWGDKYEFHRRNDYFIAIAFLQLAEMRRKKFGSWDETEVKMLFSNAATFLNWAFIKKKDIEDPELERVTAKYLYNLAVIYHRFDRLSGANSIAERGLNFLRTRDESQFRSRLRQLFVETWIANKSYRKAAQDIDVLIRTENNFKIASIAFARMADIYFALNNYELSEDMYALSNAVIRNSNTFSPTQYILRGESLFWLGRFSEAQKMFSLGVSVGTKLNKITPVSATTLPWAKLRVADAYLARYVASGRNKSKLRESAALEYYRVTHQFPNSDAGRIAEIRYACLELPFYKGNNIRHARESLKGIEPGSVPAGAFHIANACRVASIASHERTPEMVEEVKKFYKDFPNSPFLKSLVEPVREFKSAEIYKLFADDKIYNAIEFYEMKKKLLYKTVEPKLAEKLFDAYIDTYNPQKASEFYEVWNKSSKSNLKDLRKAVFASELMVREKSGSPRYKMLTRILTSATVGLEENYKDLPSTEKVSDLIVRLRVNDSKGYHDGWVLKWAESQMQETPSLGCSTVLPILSRLNRNYSKSKDRLKLLPKVQKYIDLADMNRRNPCFESYLNLEYLILKQYPEKLEEVWLSRLNWPATQPVATGMWQAADQLAKNNFLETATKLWKFIADKADGSINEKTLAKIRLDNAKTETEKLWE